MGTFLDAEKARQLAFKAATRHLSHEARADGVYRGKARPFCLPAESAQENIFCDVREAVLDYFAKSEIKWHDGKAGKPSNHLCDSQVCCVNFLFVFADKPNLLADLLRPVFPTIRTALPVEGQRWHLAFEWIGEENYLGERIRRGCKRTRGANFTSADAAVLFELDDGRRQMVLMEWKYTESYGGQSIQVSRNGTDRAQIYRHLYDREDCPLDRGTLPRFEALFYEHFYQLMRQQFLAHEMERARELGADIVSVLHIAPAQNYDLREVTSPSLREIGTSALDVWRRLLRTPDRFTSVSTERLFGPMIDRPHPILHDWADYISERYGWVRRKDNVGKAW